MMDQPEQRWHEEASDPETNADRLSELSANPSLRMAVAANPAAPEHLLEHLAQDHDQEVLRAVASNPNASWRTLEDLAWAFPREVLHNPRGLLQILAHPEQISIDDMFWESMLREAWLPPLWWKWLRSHPVLHVHPALRLHVQAAGEASSFAGVPQEEEAGTLLILVSLLTEAHAQGVRLPMLRHPDQSTIPVEQIIREHLWWVAQHGDDRVRRDVAYNCQTPREVLHTLAQDEHHEIRSGVASHRQTPREVLHTLAQDEDDGVRESVASNPQTPREMLHTLAQDQDERVRRRARFVLRVMEIAERGEGGRWREELYRVGLDLSEDEDPIRSQLEWIVDLDVAEPMRQAIITALVPDWDDTMVRFAFGHDIEDYLAAAHLLLAAFMPPIALQKLVVSPSWKVRYLVALHPRTPLQTRQRLSQDGNRYVRAMARANL